MKRRSHFFLFGGEECDRFFHFYLVILKSFNLYKILIVFTSSMVSIGLVGEGKGKRVMKGRSILGFVIKLAIVNASLFFIASIAKAESKTAQSGNVRAEVSYSDRYEGSCHTNVRFKLIRGNQRVLDQVLSTNDGVCKISELQVRDLDGNREPEIILDLFSGGAHCCFSSKIYRYDTAQRRYIYTEREWGNASYELKDIDRDGIPEFHSWDDRFAYAFSSYAGSYFALQIWQYRQGRMIDVTRNYPQAIASHANQLWQEYLRIRNEYEGGRSALAAYLAERYLMGQGQEGWRQVQQAYKGSDSQEFFAQLRSFLQENGYTSIPLLMVLLKYMILETT